MPSIANWIQEGIEEGALKIIFRQLRRRFGKLSPGLEERVRLLSIIQLEELAEALLDFGNERDLEVWLQHFSINDY